MRKALVCAVAVGILGLVSRAFVTAQVPRTTFLADKNGDVNVDGLVDMSDAIYLLQFLYLGGPRPWPLHCEPDNALANGDVNGSLDIDIADPVYILNWQFSGGPPPVEACP